MVFAGRNLLQRRGMKNDVDPAYRLSNTRAIAYITDDEIQTGLARIVMAHPIFFAHPDLLVFIPGENPYFSGFLVAQTIDDLMPERSGPARHEHPLTGKQFSAAPLHLTGPLCPS